MAVVLLLFDSLAFRRLGTTLWISSRPELDVEPSLVLRLEMLVPPPSFLGVKRNGLLEGRVQCTPRFPVKFHQSCNESDLYSSTVSCVQVGVKVFLL